MFYVFNKLAGISGVNTCPRCPNICTECASPKDLDLVDFDIFVTTTLKPYKIIHLNHLNNKVEAYSQTQVEYLFAGNTLKKAQIPFESIKWQQVSENQNNLEYAFTGSFTVGNDKVEIQIPRIYLDMVIRAQPDVGKFGGSIASPDAKIIVNGQENNAYAVVTAAFFNKFTPVDYKAAKVRTHWMMFFDKDWNFYHLDKTEVENQSDAYYAHSFFSKISGTDTTVRYFTDINASGVPASSLLVTYSQDGTALEKNFTLKSSVTPYPGASMFLIEANDGSEGTEGVGLYLYVDSALAN